MTCRAIANRTFISVELLLSLVTLDPKNLIFQHDHAIALPAIVITWSASLSASITIMCVFVALIVSPNGALMFSIAETCCCNKYYSLHDLAIRIVSSAYLKFQTDLPPMMQPARSDISDSNIRMIISPHVLNSIDDKTQPCLTPFSNGN